MSLAPIDPFLPFGIIRTMKSTIEKVWRWLAGGATIKTPSTQPVEPARPEPEIAAKTAAEGAEQGAGTTASEAAGATPAAPAPPRVPVPNIPSPAVAAEEKIGEGDQVGDAQVKDTQVKDARVKDTQVSGPKVSSPQVGRAASSPPDQQEIQRRRELVRTLFNDFWSGRDDKPAAFVDRLNEAESYLNERLAATGEVWQLDAATRKMLGLPARSHSSSNGSAAVHR